VFADCRPDLRLTEVTDRTASVNYCTAVPKCMWCMSRHKLYWILYSTGSQRHTDFQENLHAVRVYRDMCRKITFFGCTPVPPGGILGYNMLLFWPYSTAKLIKPRFNPVCKCHALTRNLPQTLSTGSPCLPERLLQLLILLTVTTKNL